MLPRDDLQVAPLRLDAPDRVEHAVRMAVRGVDHHHVDAGLAQRRDAIERVRRRADGCADAQAAAMRPCRRAGIPWPSGNPSP